MAQTAPLEQPSSRATSGPGPNWAKPLWRAAPAAVFGLGLAITLLVWTDWRMHRREALRGSFETLVTKIGASIERRINANEQILRGIAGLFAASEQVSRTEFHDYVTILRLGERFPGIQAIGFTALTAGAAARPDAERAAGRDGAPTPIGESAGAGNAVRYIEPPDWRNQRALGRDMFAEPIRREAMLRAWLQDKPALSGRVILAQETDEDVQAGFLIYDPIYRRGAPHETTEDRRANLIGWAFSAVRMRNLMTALLGQSYPDLGTKIELEIYDGTDLTSRGLMYHSAPDLVPGPDSFRHEVRIDFGGHSWLIRARALPSFSARQGLLLEKGLLIPVAGLFCSLLLALVVWVLLRAHLRVAEALRATAQAHHELEDSQQRLQLIFDTSDVAIFLADLDGRITQANQRMAEMFRCPLGRLLGSHYIGHIHPSERELGRTCIRELFAQRIGLINVERRYSRADGSDFWGHFGGRTVRDTEGTAVGLVGVIADISHRKEAEEKIQFIAHHDHLTGLANRALLVERLAQALALAQRYRRQAGVLFLDLDGFKPINDQHGHQIGDLVLQEIATRLVERRRASDTVCRQGGDEFVIVVPETPGRDHLERLAEHVARAVARPITVAGLELRVTASIGLALYPDQGSTVEELLNAADSAMYLAKASRHRHAGEVGLDRRSA